MKASRYAPNSGQVSFKEPTLMSLTGLKPLIRPKKAVLKLPNELIIDTAYLYSFDNYHLPASGNPKTNCGTVRFRVQCEKCGMAYDKEPNDKDLRYNHCDRALCPICSQTWARKQANRAADRIWSALKQHKPRLRTPRHVVLSVPYSQYHIPYNDLLAKGLKLIKSMGAIGGLYIGHPWRFIDIYGESVPWKHSSTNPNAQQPVIETYGKYSPHIHFIVWGYFPETGREFFERTGWIYRTIDPLPKKVDVFFCVNYQLSHCGIHSSRHSLRYFGIVSYNNFIRISTPTIKEQQYCQCGGRLWILKDVEGSPYPIPYELYKIKITKRHYMFKKDMVPIRASTDIRHKGRKGVQCSTLKD